MASKKEVKKDDKLHNVLDLRDKKNKAEKEPAKEEKKTKEKPAKKKRSWLKIVGLSIAGIFVVVNLIFAFGIYVQGWVNVPTRFFTKILPYPAARAGWSFVRLDEYYKDLSSYINYYKKVQEVDFNSEDGKSIFESLKGDTLDLLIEEDVIEKEAKKMGISVSKGDVDTEYNSNVQKAGGEETLLSQVKELYKWDKNTFREKIEKALMRDKLIEKVGNDEELNKENKKKAEDILARIKNGEDFATLAKEFSQSPNAAEGGSLGWLSEGTYSEAFDKAAFALEKGQMSDVVKTDMGYEIIKVEDKKEGEILARHILIKGVDFKEWLEGKKKEYGVQKFLDTAKIKYSDKI